MLGLLDTLLPEGSPAREGVGAARRNRVPRWLVEIQRLNKLYFLASVGGQLPPGLEWPDKVLIGEVGLPPLEDVFWDEAIVDVSPSQLEVDLEAMRIPLPSATISLVPNLARLFDPMTDLAQAQARVSYFDGKKVRRVVRGLSEDIQVGFDGELVTFRIVEKWRTNPPFPPAKHEVPARVDASRIIESVEDESYSYVFGSPRGVPIDAYRSYGEDEPPEPLPVDEDEPPAEEPASPLNEEDAGRTRILVHGTSLTRKMDVSDAGRDPCPYVGFPHPEHPEVGPLAGSSIVGLWYGKNRVLRDTFGRVGMSRKWEITSGTFAQNESGATKLESTDSVVPCTAKWTDWNYEETLSLAMRVEAIDPEARACVYWNYLDEDNHARIEFKFGSKKIRVLSVVAGVEEVVEAKKLGDSVDDVDEDVEEDIRIPEDEFKLTLDITNGRLTAGVKEGPDPIVVEMGEVPDAVSGRMAIGSRDGKVRFHFLTQPSMKAEGQTAADLNAAIRIRKDKLNHSLVCEDYKEQPGQPMFADYHRAQNTHTAGQLIERLVRDYSNLDVRNIDDRTFNRLVEDLDRLVIGSVFNDEQPIFDLISSRLSPEFMFLLTQEAGLLKGFMFDPTLPPQRKLVFGVDLLELAEPIGEFEKFNEFRVKWAWNEARKTKNGKTKGWGKKASLTSENFRYFLGHRRRYGHNPFPREIELGDVYNEGTAQLILLIFALIFHAGQRAVYLQRATPGGDILLGERVLIDDPERGWSEKRAFLVGREIVDPSYVLNVFRTVEYFEEAGSGGAEIVAPAAEEEDPTLFPLGACWAPAESSPTFEDIGDGLSSISDGYVLSACACSEDLVGALSGAGGEQFTVHMLGSGNRGATPGANTLGLRMRARWYSGVSCGTFLSEDNGDVTNSGGAPNVNLHGCRRFTFTAPNGATSVRFLIGADDAGLSAGAAWAGHHVTIVPGPAGADAADFQDETNPLTCGTP